MKEFPGGGNTVQEQYFGYRLSSARMVIECAFGRLKGRFGAFCREMDINIDELLIVIHACFVWHNLCEINNDYIPQEDGFFFNCNTTYKDIQYTTLLTLLTLLTTQYYITFSFPFAHTERKRKEKKKGRNYLQHLYFRYFKILHVAME